MQSSKHKWHVCIAVIKARSIYMGIFRLLDKLIYIFEQRILIKPYISSLFSNLMTISVFCQFVISIFGKYSFRSGAFGEIPQNQFETYNSMQNRIKTLLWSKIQSNYYSMLEWIRLFYKEKILKAKQIQMK